ncbi:phage terminase large subunit family protein [Paracoccus broussonetiae]|uniref:phage terminase large subunit family protein n=1 Tax=Paracoccus broussonetiae TaxID=3075834 RepID=UPI00288BED97|nr:terminase family protein [Paracoccus sp. CPCC 101403]
MTKPQRDFLTSPAIFRAFVAGFGAGKTETLAIQAIMDACHGSDALIGVYAPTYDLVRMVAAMRIELKLSELGIRGKWHGQDKAIYTSHPGIGDFIFRTLDEPARIVGFETFSAHLDELDTLKTEHAREAWNKVLGRNRQRIKAPFARINRASVYTTPEGFRFTYDRWVANKTPDYEIIRASTYSNTVLMRDNPDYVRQLRDSYPAQLIDAYIDGQFVNLTSGSVYSSYDRIRCESNETIREGEQLYIGQDFNVGQMASVIMVRRVDGYHAVEELMGVLDTPALIDALHNRYSGHAIRIYPDASGKSRKTVDASRSDLILLKDAGFKVVVDASNPAVRDRIVSVNNGFSQGRLWVNSRACPTLAAALEQQAYATNGEPDKEGGFDHPNDAIGYAVVKEMPVRKPMRRPDTVQQPSRPPDYRPQRVQADDDWML